MNKYQAIVQDILSGIEQHRFRRGEKLPSIRSLSKHYQCSKDTVQKAMLELKYKNKIYAVEKSGYYIVEDRQFQDYAVELNPEAFQELPYEDFRVCLHESLIGRENYLFNYYHQQEGLAELISSVQSLLMDYHVYTQKDQLVITAGSQQALYILTQMNICSDKTDILLENPTYSRMVELIQHQGIPYQTIERDLDGIDLKRLEEIFQTGRIQFFYTIPRLHNPLGSTYDTATKTAILELAEKYDVYVIEDDYLADFDSNRSLPLHYLDTNNRVIYIKSFTPTLFPALRIGAVSLPKQLHNIFIKHKRLIDYDTNLIMQKALSLYIDNGMFSRNTRHLQQIHHSQLADMKTCLEKYSVNIPYCLSKKSVTFQLDKGSIIPAIQHQLAGMSYFSGREYDFLQMHYNTDFSSRLILLLNKLGMKKDI
ncbi:aminotransferase-like domain-containing protein [Streptococcus ruminantium]|uniref:PLP-dependent aminotransferase family protein n=1 Tax=Streptococcus ruminantium TaxID=1917441 RepID=A0ABU1B3C6_9STRE|nr:PLP-dependent aminotransferase family protein [Streptococcus ruminantium]MDQ8759811.1 PLP-dependent aminotransferase family protein [Streptococcus ruminantium]MDQ8768851.1 PLP-dependent aminotransferase family protein [Streptococcus ruminantium]MDQ8774788.1 PLP-dependent aminotransferase family protein [Streptococcus ruminantium]MDQ8794937.1 PLP-dependent aminotransferase family protein [Streptococcus ruminantium]MDQ8796420.1 PLP-dependent aminotransferase family protein [Streptococcus rumi